jgi:hypothetical protein
LQIQLDLCIRSPDDWATREVGGSLRSVQHVQDQSNTLRKHMASFLGLGLGAKGRHIIDFFFKKIESTMNINLFYRLTIFYKSEQNFIELNL